MYCSYSFTRKIQNGFLQFLLLLLRSTLLLLNGNMYMIGNSFFAFKCFHCPQLFYFPPHDRCSSVGTSSVTDGTRRRSALLGQANVKIGHQLLFRL